MFNWFEKRSQSPPDPIVKRVALIVHNPRIPSEGGKRLEQVLGWNNPYELTRDFIKDLREVSYGYANYRIVEKIEVDAFPIKEDGFRYKSADYIRHWRERGGWHSPDWVDYAAILNDYNMVDKVNRGFVDEVWLHAFPSAGYYESRMVGPGAFWCNAPELNMPNCQRRFVVMGFNFERGVGEMLESYGHRAESIMKQTYRHKRAAANMWQRFIQYDQTHPQRAGVGNVHFAPNSLRDYDWGNATHVQSCADDWLDYPNLTGKMRRMDCSDWGDGDTRAHHQWWFNRIPHVGGELDGIANNWWHYIADPNYVI